MDFFILSLLSLAALAIFILIPACYFINEHRAKKREQKLLEESFKRHVCLQRKIKLMRPNMLRRYEEKKAEGLAELDKWCKQYMMSIHDMEVFLGLAEANHSDEILEKLQDLENGIYAPRISVPIGL